MKQQENLNKDMVTGSGLQGEPLPGNGSGTESRGRLLLAALMALLSFIVYLPALQNGFVSWDDGHYVYENSHLNVLNWEFFKWALTDVDIVYWHPLTWISHALDVAIWGLNPLGHHLTNIILHGGNTFIVVILVSRVLLTERMSARTGDISTVSAMGWQELLIATGVTGALFGLHPLHVESVAWVAERKDLLYSLFYLLGLLSYTEYVCNSSSSIGKWGFLHNRRYYLTLLYFFLALGSKPMAVTFPAIIMLLDWYPFRRDFALKRLSLLLEKAPFFALGGVIAIITVIAQKNVGAMVVLSDISFGDRVLVAFQSTVIYFGKMLFPVGLLPLYPYPEKVSLLMPEYAGSILLVTGVTVACILIAKKQRIWITVWGYFLVSVFPVLGLMQAGPQPLADRFVYLPSLGPFMLVGIGTALVWRKSAASLAVRRSVAVLALILVALMSGVTVVQIGIWKSSMVMWNHVIEKVPHRLPMAYQNRGILFMDAGEYDRAIEDATQAIALAPDYHDAYHNRGNALAGKGEFAKAIADYKRAISLKPDDAVLYNSLGLAYAAMGLSSLAIDSYGKSISLRAEYMEAYNNRGLAYAGVGELALAINDYNRAGELKPGEASVYINRGLAFAGQGRAEQAEKEYTTALQLKPAPALAVKALSNRGILRFNRRDYDLALSDFNAAAELSPDVVAVYFNRGTLYRVLGEYTRAAEDFSRVLELDPGMGNAYLYRGDMYLQGGNRAAAKKDFMAACKMGSAVGCSRAQSLPSAR
jgi:tetratricopeptide (TPR) repeat protein